MPAVHSKRYGLALLTLVCTLSYLDRGLIILLLQPIKDDLHLSDTQLGFLTGIAFGLFYAVLGVPIARWADRGNRVTITSLAMGLWGITVMASVLVTSFVQLVLVRIAAAVGEAGGMPPTYSLLGDYFPEAKERTRAMSVYWMAAPIAALISFVGGGWLAGYLGWRMTFFVMGIPGLLLALLVKITMQEPRIDARVTCVTPPTTLRLSEVLAFLWQQRSLRHLSIGIILLATLGLGLGPWYAAFLTRNHGMGTAELGAWLGLIVSLGGLSGAWLGGQVAVRWFADDERGQLRLNAILFASLTPCYLLFLLLRQKHEALLALVPLMVINSFVFGPTFALLQRLVADEMRATTLAVVMLLANLIGMGLGPQLVGLLSDALTPLAGRDSLRYSMLTLSLVALWGGWHFWRVAATVQADLSATAQHLVKLGQGLSRSTPCA